MSGSNSSNGSTSNGKKPVDEDKTDAQGNNSEFDFSFRFGTATNGVISEEEEEDENFNGKREEGQGGSAANNTGSEIRGRSNSSSGAKTPFVSKVVGRAASGGHKQSFSVLNFSNLEVPDSSPSPLLSVGGGAGGPSPRRRKTHRKGKLSMNLPLIHMSTDDDDEPATDQESSSASNLYRTGSNGSAPAIHQTSSSPVNGAGSNGSGGGEKTSHPIPTQKRPTATKLMESWAAADDDQSETTSVYDQATDPGFAFATSTPPIPIAAGTAGNISRRKTSASRHSAKGESLHIGGDEADEMNNEEQEAEDLQQQLSVVQGDTDDEDLDAIAYLHNQSKEGEKELARRNSSARRFGKRIVISLILIALVLVPGLLCYYLRLSYCPMFGDVSLIQIGAVITVVIGCLIISDISVFILTHVVNKVPVLEERFAYYVNELETPSKLLAWFVIVYIAYTTVLSNLASLATLISTLKNQDFLPRFTYSCIVFSLGFVLRAILLRYISISYHRGAYINRIKNAIFVEYVFAKMIRYIEYTELLIRNADGRDPDKYSSVKHNFFSLRRGSNSNNNFANFFGSIRSNGAGQSQNSTSNQDAPSNAMPNAPSIKTNGNFSVYTKVKSLFNNPLTSRLAPDLLTQATNSYFSESLTLGNQKITERDLIYGDYGTYQLSNLIEYLKRNVTLKCMEASIKLLLSSSETEDLSISECLRRIGGAVFERLITVRRQSSTKLVQNGGGGIPEEKTEDLFEEENHDDEDDEEDEEEIQMSDFELFFRNKKLVKPAFHLIDVNLDGSLTKVEFQTSLVLVYKERRALLKSLIEGEKAIKTVHNILTLAIVSLLILIVLTIFDFNVTGLMVTLGSVMVSLSFAMGKSIERMVDSIQFLFLTHPFDIGDRVSVNNEVFIVNKMTLLGTELIRHDNVRILFPNSELLSIPITNIRRSPDQFDILKIDINFSTPAKKIQLLERKIATFLLQHSAHFYRTFELEVKEVEELNKLTIRIWIQHRNNFQNMKRFRERRSFALIKIKLILEELGIAYSTPTTDVNMLTWPPKSSFPNQLPTAK